MAKLTLEELHDILKKPNNDCDGYELHIKHCWMKGNSKSIFEITGLDVSGMIGRHEDKVNNPKT